MNEYFHFPRHTCAWRGSLFLEALLGVTVIVAGISIFVVQNPDYLILGPRNSIHGAANGGFQDHRGHGDARMLDDGRGLEIAIETYFVEFQTNSIAIPSAPFASLERGEGSSLPIAFATKGPDWIMVTPEPTDIDEWDQNIAIPTSESDATVRVSFDAAADVRMIK